MVLQDRVNGSSQENLIWSSQVRVSMGLGLSAVVRPTLLTKMTETDWGTAIELFRAVRFGRGEPGRNDRKFQEGLQNFTVHTSQLACAARPSSAIVAACRCNSGA